MIKSFESKKIMALPMMMIFGILSYGTNVDDLILQYEKNSYTTKINEKSMKKFDIKDKALKNGDWNEITVNSDNNYILHSEANGLTMENNVKYGIFYYRNGYNFRSKEVTQNKIGVSKTLNDYFGYSDNNYNKKTNQISRNIQKITNEATKNSEIRDLIDLYKNYKNKEKEIEQEALTMEDTKKDYAIQAKKYEV